MTSGAATTEGDWDGLVVFFAGTAWDGNKFPDQHMAERLSRWAPVLYVDPPLSVVRSRHADGARAPLPRLERLSESMLRLVPVVPPAPLRPGVRLVSYAVMRALARRTARMLTDDVQAVVVASLSPLLDAVPARVRALYGTDDFVAGAELMGVGGRWLEAREKSQLARADVVVAVSDDLATSWGAKGADVAVVPNGCDAALFATADQAPVPSDVALPSPIAGFVGHMSERIDLSLLEGVADTGHSLLLVGPRQHTFAPERLHALLQRPNVQWVGAKPFEDLPSYVRVMDVGLVPYADTAFNRASFPLKTLEYLAAGRPVVATGLPAIRYLCTDEVAIADSPVPFAAAVTRASAFERDPQAVERRQEVARSHSWDQRAVEFAQLIGVVADGGTPTG